MKKITKTFYKCEICGAEYHFKKEAQKCESKPVTQNKGVKIGDVIKITTGDGKGMLGKVDRIHIHTKDWGHYAWKRYWHTVALEVKVINSWGCRALFFDDYEIISKEEAIIKLL